MKLFGTKFYGDQDVSEIEEKESNLSEMSHEYNQIFVKEIIERVDLFNSSHSIL